MPVHCVSLFGFIIYILQCFWLMLLREVIIKFKKNLWFIRFLCAVITCFVFNNNTCLNQTTIFTSFATIMKRPVLNSTNDYTMFGFEVNYRTGARSNVIFRANHFY